MEVLDVKFHGNGPVKFALIHADRQTDGHDEDFRDYANVPNKVRKNSSKFYQVLCICSVLQWRRGYEARVLEFSKICGKLIRPWFV
jgi:hypothetical protein